MSPADFANLKKAITLLYEWQHGGTSFTSGLFTLLSKADHANRQRIRMGWPSEFEAWRLWQQASDQDKFFHQWGLPGTRTEGATPL